MSLFCQSWGQYSLYWVNYQSPDKEWRKHVLLWHSVARESPPPRRFLRKACFCPLRIPWALGSSKVLSEKPGKCVIYIEAYFQIMHWYIDNEWVLTRMNENSQHNEESSKDSLEVSLWSSQLCCLSYGRWEFEVKTLAAQIETVWTCSPWEVFHKNFSLMFDLVWKSLASFKIDLVSGFGWEFIVDWTGDTVWGKQFWICHVSVTSWLHCPLLS